MVVRGNSPSFDGNPGGLRSAASVDFVVPKKFVPKKSSESHDHALVAIGDLEFHDNALLPNENRARLRSASIGRHRQCLRRLLAKRGLDVRASDGVRLVSASDGRRCLCLRQYT